MKLRIDHTVPVVDGTTISREEFTWEYLKNNDL